MHSSLPMRIDNVELSYLGHDGFSLKNGKHIIIDPLNVSKNVKKADVILITHDHFDHCSIKDIQALSQQGTIVICPPHVQSAVAKVEGIHLQLIEVGDTIEMGDIKIEAVPAYNTNKYRDPAKKLVFHPKSEGYVGYLIKMGKVIIYHSGDTDVIPEMKNLTGYGKHGNQFVALLPVSGTYVMDADEAHEAAGIINPDLAIPMHYGAVVGTLEDAQRFVDLCRADGIRAELLEKI